MAEPDHVVILLELLGAKLMAGDEAEGTGDFTDIFQRILLLAPGFEEMPDIEEPSFGISNVSIACLQYLRHKQKALLVPVVTMQFSSRVLVNGGECSDPSRPLWTRPSKQMKEDKSTSAGKNRLRRLFDVAVDAFTDTSLEDEYRRRRNEVVIYG
jgi:hypothetical protein